MGANQLQRDTQVPAALITALNGLIVIAVVSSERIRRRLMRGGSVATDVGQDADPGPVRVQ